MDCAEFKSEAECPEAECEWDSTKEDESICRKKDLPKPPVTESSVWDTIPAGLYIIGFFVALIILLLLLGGIYAVSNRVTKGQWNN